MLTIPITFLEINFLTNFLIFFRLYFLRKIVKIKYFQVGMTMDRNLNYELNEV